MTKQEFMQELSVKMGEASRMVHPKINIGHDDLTEYGFERTEGLYCYEKQIGEDTEDDMVPLTLAVKHDGSCFCLILGDGSNLDFNISSLEHLKVIEMSINGWEPNY